MFNHCWALKRLNNLWTFHFYIFLHCNVVFNNFSIFLATHANLPNVWCYLICFFLGICDCWIAWNMGGRWILLLHNLFEVSLGCNVWVWGRFKRFVVILFFNDGSICEPHGTIVDCWAWKIRSSSYSHVWWRSSPKWLMP